MPFHSSKWGPYASAPLPVLNDPVLGQNTGLPLSPTLSLRGLITISLHHRQAFICQCAEGTESSVADAP